MSLQQILVATGGGASLDPDAQAFIAAAGITDPTQESAINTLVLGLKAGSLWTKMQACYPFVGGTATTHKYNLANPADTDGAYRITFNGGWTHNANGVTPNGSTGYANTHLAGSDQTNFDVHYSLYSRTSTTVGSALFDVGALAASVGPQMICCTSILGGVQMLADNTEARITGTVADGLGLFTSSRQDAVTVRGYRNSTEIGINSAGDASNITSITNPYYLGCRNLNGVASDFSTRNLAFASFGLGLSAGDVANLTTLVQAFQTTLGRQV